MVLCLVCFSLSQRASLGHLSSTLLQEPVRLFIAAAQVGLSQDVSPAFLPQLAALRASLYPKSLWSYICPCLYFLSSPSVSSECWSYFEPGCHTAACSYKYCYWANGPVSYNHSKKKSDPHRGHLFGKTLTGISVLTDPSLPDRSMLTEG